jgi:PAS domain S-box-containing protein
LLPANVIFDHAFRTNLQAGTSKRTEFHSEFLDVSRFSSEAQQENQRDFLRKKYLEYPPDLIIAVSGSAVAFLLKYRASLFTGTPVIYLTWQGEASPRDLPDPRAVVISIPGSLNATLRLALALQPDTRRIAVVTGTSQRDKVLTEEAREGSKAFENRVAFTWLTDLSLPELRDKLARLPDHTVVLYLTLFQDAAGSRFTPQEALDQFASASRVPIYAYYDTYLGHGIIGGSFVTFEEIGRTTAQAGLRMLAGESPQSVTRSEIARAVPMFDWRELRRSNISESKLPLGSVVRFKEVTYWERHYWLILGIVSASLIEALLIAVLLAQLRRRRQAEAFLRESEERLNLATTSAGAGLWAIDQTTRQIWLTDRARQLFGLSPVEAPYWENLLSAIHPDDREQTQNSVEEALRTGKEFMADFRMVCPDGSVRWISSRGGTRFGSHAKLQRLMGACVDITERKRAEEETSRHFQELVHITRVSLVGELSGSLVHELSQPLGAILTNSEAAEMHLAHATPNLDEVRGIFVDLRLDAIRATEVVQGMRAFLRGQELPFERVDLNSLMGAMKKIAGPDIARRGATLDVRVAANLPPVWGHPVQLQQVLLNLVLNSLEAMKGASYGDRKLSITACAYEGSFVEIAVADTGHGLPPDKLDQVFAPFITSRKTGLGMGLSICRRIIEAHRGRIWIENNANCGATVRFILPMMPASPS